MPQSMAPRKRPTAASVSDVALYDMTVQEILKKVRATPGVSEKKKVDGKWVSKKKDDMIADLTYLTTSASDSHPTYLRAPKDLVYGELWAEVMARPGASEKKKVDGQICFKDSCWRSQVYIDFRSKVGGGEARSTLQQ